MSQKTIKEMGHFWRQGNVLFARVNVESNFSLLEHRKKFTGNNALLSTFLFAKDIMSHSN